MAGAADDGDGGRGHAEVAAPAGALEVGLEAELAFLFSGLAAEGGDGRGGGDARHSSRAENGLTR